MSEISSSNLSHKSYVGNATSVRLSRTKSRTKSLLKKIHSEPFRFYHYSFDGIFAKLLDPLTKRMEDYINRPL